MRRVCEAAPALGVGTLTLYAFSSDNFRRPPEEVSALMGLVTRFLRDELPACLRQRVRLGFLGRRTRLPAFVRAAIHTAERATRRCERLHVRIALDYSSRDAILRAAAQCGKRTTRDEFGRLLSGGLAVPDVDLLIRTGGDQRLSDFLLWECAYAEFLFTQRLWPDFDAGDLAAAVRDFESRERRFGGLSGAATGGGA